MVQFDTEELLKIAELSALRLDEDEVGAFCKQLKILLEYIEELQEVTVTQGLEPTRNINVFREDKIVITDSQPLINQAPVLDGTSIVVPKIID